MPAPIGNKHAVKAKLWQKALERALARAGDGTVDDGLNPIADKVVAAAMAGDKDAWKEIGDRLDGKPGQSIDIDLTRRTVSDMADTDLAGVVAKDGGSGVAGEALSPSQPAGLH